MPISPNFAKNHKAYNFLRYITRPTLAESNKIGYNTRPTYKFKCYIMRPTRISSLYHKANKNFQCISCGLQEFLFISQGLQMKKFLLLLYL